jgi:NACHT domain/Sulfatase-modifying factor enzyme 1
MSNSSPKNSLPALISNLLLFAGIPAVLSTTIYVSTKNIAWTIIICLICEIVAFIINIIKQIAHNVGGRVADSATELVLLFLKQLVSNPQGKYYEHLSNNMNELDMKGLTTGSFSLLLEDVFVDLSVRPTSPHSASANPVKSLRELRMREGEKSIWDYLSPQSAEKRHLVILGPPGSGKTTLLRHIAINLVPGSSNNFLIKLFNTIKITIIPTSKIKTPIILYLRENIRFLVSNPEASLFEMVCDDLKRKNMPIPLEWMKHKLEKGRCIILLDGLDEVADVALRHRVVDWVRIQMNAYHQNHFLITSRPYGYTSYPLTEVGIIVLEVLPFTKDRVKQFVHRWYNANEISNAQQNKKDSATTQAALAGAKDLLQRMINKPALFDLAVNPLLLTMITTVHRYRNHTLPGQRIGLYKEICEVFLGKRQEMRGIDLELTSDAKRQVLQRLAFVMISTKKRGISLVETEAAITDTLSQVAPSMQPQNFLKLVENSSGLLLEKEAGIYEFAHLTFQEYLASTYIKEERMEQLLIENINTSWWHETIRLYCAQTDASNIITACIENLQPSISTLVLALECVNESLGMQPSIRKRLDEFINQSIEHSNPDQRHLIAETFLTQRTQQMKHLGIERYVDKTFVSCAEYQLFLDDQQQNGIYCSPDHWDRNFFPANHGKLPVMGIRPSDAKMFCAWLTNRSSSGIWQYQLPTTDDLEKLADEEGIQRILDIDKGTTYWIDDGKGAAANDVYAYTTTMKQNYFDPKNLYAILPFLKLILTLPRTCATTFSPEKAHNYVATLHPIIQLARTFAEGSGVPDWIIAYYSSLTSENAFSSSLPPTPKRSPHETKNSSLNIIFPVFNPDLYYPSKKQGETFLPDMPPNPSTAFNNMDNFLRKVISPSPYIASFLDAVDTHIKQNGLTLDPKLDQSLLNGDSSIFKISQTAESVFTTVTRNLNKIKNTLNRLDDFSETFYYEGTSHDIFTVLYHARNHPQNEQIRNINFSILDTQLEYLAKQLMARQNTPAFNLNKSIPFIIQIIDEFDLKTLLDIDTITTISRMLLHTLDLSRQRTFNSLYIDNNILPTGSTLLFLHLFLRILTIRLVAYLRKLLKIMGVMHKYALLSDTDNYTKAKTILNEAIDQCISIYATSTIIGARYQNQLPALEGILLIKEPQEEQV